MGLRVQVCWARDLLPGALKSPPSLRPQSRDERRSQRPIGPRRGALSTTSAGSYSRPMSKSVTITSRSPTLPTRPYGKCALKPEIGPWGRPSAVSTP